MNLKNIDSRTDIEIYNAVKTLSSTMNDLKVNDVIFDELIKRKSDIVFDIFKEFNLFQNYHMIYTLINIDFEKTMKYINPKLITDEIKNNSIHELNLKIIDIIKDHPHVILTIKNPTIPELLTAITYPDKLGIIDLDILFEKINDSEKIDYLLELDPEIIVFMPEQCVKREQLIKCINKKVLNIDDLPEKFENDKEILAMFK